MMLMMAITGRAGPGPVPLPAPEPDWNSLIARTARGEQEGFARLYDLSSRLVYSVALRILSNTADAEEVTLDVFSQVWRSAKDYQTGRGTPQSWIIMMARSRALDRLRSRDVRWKREGTLEEVAEARSGDPPPEQMALEKQTRARVREAMASLPAEQREVIDLAFFEGLTHTELAERLGSPLGTVKTRIRAGMIRLRQVLGTDKEVQ